MSELPQNTILTGEWEYSQAIDEVLRHAERELLIFDQDFKTGRYTSIEREGLLRDFLAKNAQNELTIILNDVTFFLNDCPRLFQLLSVYGHRMTVYQTHASAQVAKECFVIADQQHYVKRIHIDQARFKYALNDATAVASLMMRFEALKEALEYPVSTTTLGL